MCTCSRCSSLPTLHLDIDRNRVTQVGMNARDVAQSVLVSLSGSFQTAPNFWLNPKNGVTYQVAVQSPQYRMTSLQDLMNMPVNDPGSAELAGAGQPGAVDARGAAGGGLALQRAAGDRRLCQHAGPRPGRGGQGYDEGAAAVRGSTCRAARASSFAARWRPCSLRSSAWASDW